MKQLKGITTIIGMLIKYAPIVITVVKALQMVQDELKQIENDTKA